MKVFRRARRAATVACICASCIFSVAAQQQQQQTFLPQQGFPISAYGGPAGWLAGTPGVQPQVFGGQAGYVM